MTARERFRSRVRRCGLPAVLAAAAAPLPAAGQLRPLSPIDWSAAASSRPFSAGLGLGWLSNQIASLAGTRGDLLDLGRFHVGYWSGRIGVEAEGTVYRRFEDESVLRPPSPSTDPPTGAARTDAGDVVVTTVIRLSPEHSRLTTALRFSTRLPTASDEPGIERDRSDFFATFAGRLRRGRAAFGGEAGVGILGTRNTTLDQLDVLAWNLFAEARLGALTAAGVFAGHNDLKTRIVRGNEDLSEVRLAVRAGGRRWISLTAVRGISEYSPGAGVYFMIGIRR